MGYPWTKNLETGNPVIDRQHQDMFQAANELPDACTQGKGCALLQETGAFLQNYVEAQFRDEERLALQCGCPACAAHRQQHEEFRQEVQDLVRQLSLHGATVTLVARVNHAIGGWLVRHIRGEDAKLAAYIREKSA